jgi:drug/metabolite transporter superfamily protein YnfA
LVFDVGSESYTTWKDATLPACISVALALLAVVALRYSRSPDTKAAKSYAAFAGVASIITAIWSFDLLSESRSEYDRLVRASRLGHYQIVEGRVTDFVPEGADGHPRERFRVGSSSFDYSTSDMTSAFHRTASQGGPIRANLWVRIASVDGYIVRLEIAN